MEEDRKEVANDIQTNLEDTVKKMAVEDAILGKETEFEVLGKTYRVIRPTTAIRTEAYNKKVVRYMQLLKEKDEKGEFIFYPEKQLRKLYKDRGIDIEEIETSIKSLELKKKDYLEKLGKALTENVPENELEIFRKEIEGINELSYGFQKTKSDLLEYSLENQSTGYLYEYITYLITEVKNEKGEWERAFKTFDDFKKADGALINVISLYAGLLLGSM